MRKNREQQVHDADGDRQVPEIVCPVQKNAVWAYMCAYESAYKMIKEKMIAG